MPAGTESIAPPAMARDVLKKLRREDIPTCETRVDSMANPFDAGDFFERALSGEPTGIPMIRFTPILAVEHCGYKQTRGKSKT